MYVNPLTPPTIFPVPQSVLNPWERQLDFPRPIQGLAGLGCADCGGTCCDAKKKNSGGPGLGNWSENLTQTLGQASPFSSLLVHLLLLGLAVSAFKWLFLSEDSAYGARRAAIRKYQGRYDKAKQELATAKRTRAL